MENNTATLIVQGLKALQKIKTVEKAWIETCIVQSTGEMRMYVKCRCKFKNVDKKQEFSIESNDIIAALAQMHMVITEKSKSKIIRLIDDIKDNIKI